MSQISLTARKSVVQMFSKSDIEIALNFAGIEIENLEMLAWFEHEGESSSSSQWDSVAEFARQCKAYSAKHREANLMANCEVGLRKSSVA